MICEAEPVCARTNRSPRNPLPVKQSLTSVDAPISVKAETHSSRPKPKAETHSTRSLRVPIKLEAERATPSPHPKAERALHLREDPNPKPAPSPGDIAKPTKQDKEDDGKFIECLEEWDSKNHQIITWLSNTSIPAIHTQFDAFENAKELWDFLFTRFKSIGLAHYYQLHNNLVNLNQEVGQSVNEYLAVLQPIWTQLDQAKISKDHLRLIKVLMGLRPEYESVRAALLHRNPLPSLDAVIQEILFEEKRLGINLSKHSDVVLASTYSPLGASSTFCKNRKLTGHKFIDCPKIECRYCHKPGHILDNCPIKPPRPRSYFTRAKNFTKPRNSSVVAATLDNSTTPQFQISDLQSLLNQLISSSSSALAVSSGSGSVDGTDDWDGSQSGKIV
ncbi:Zinc finger, CCHC-type [Cucumis melo var. makuwa]|uniref:Zinc finger, CCHC-type n=1 Tax=Cucumis melo var. makuwa TaxID=1194695 RepID=A0A5A7UUZ4_CUCMM|nr:Zinc finger, CCHC-type [Cucumis melo var. makuwa]